MRRFRKGKHIFTECFLSDIFSDIRKFYVVKQACLFMMLSPVFAARCNVLRHSDASFKIFLAA